MRAVIEFYLMSTAEVEEGSAPDAADDANEGEESEAYVESNRVSTWREPLLYRIIEGIKALF